MLNYTRDIIKFDPREFNFNTIVLDWLNKLCMERNTRRITDLSEIHGIPDIGLQIEEYRQHLFKLFRTPHFQKVYRSFGKWLIDAYFSPDAVIQKTPTVRIHLTGGKSVSFHSDAWYGHGQNVNSFWLPLTRVWGSNSLQMARSSQESRAFLRQIGLKRLDLDAINTQSEQLCEAVDAGFGDLIVFNGDVIHGTVENRTGFSRVSFDFRIAHSASDLGNKPLTNFYSYTQLLQAPMPESGVAPRRRRALMYSSTCRAVSAKSQLVFLSEFARINSIDVVGSESEIVVFDYAPVLHKYARLSDAGLDCILLFSVDALPRDRKLRERIYDDSLKSGVHLIFGSEDITLARREDIREVERLISDYGTTSSFQAA